MMRISILALALGFFSAGFAEEKAPNEAPKAVKDELAAPGAKLSYALGMEIGDSLKRMPIKVDLAVFMKAVKDSFDDKDLLLTQEQAQSAKSELIAKIQEQRESKAKALADKNLQEGQAFLAENKKKAGVVTTPSGLQYEVISEGSGAKPAATDHVKVHYSGKLLDGTEFDSSYKRGEPASIILDRVIPGWKEGVPLMTVGSKYRFFIPADLAYGARGARGAIGPNCALVFDVELMEIEKKE